MKHSKRKVWMAMALALAAGGAKADGLQIYGILDNSVEYLSNAGGNANGSKSSLLRASNGSQAPNRFGFKGSEDLGGGLKAIMQLEAGINLNTGQLQQGGRMFGRQAYVGLQNEWGALTLGRQKNLIYDAFLELDPLSYYSYALPALDPQFVGKADNSIKYAGNFSGVKIAGLFSTGYDASIANGGQVPGEWRVGKEYGVSLGYANGPLNVSVAYDQQQGTSVATQGATTQRVAAGASYAIGNWKPYIGYQWYLSKVPGVAGRNELYFAGLQYRPVTEVILSGAIYYNNITSANQHPYLLAANAAYLISKRTQLFAEVGFSRNQNGSNLGVTGYGMTIVPGSNQVGVAVGLAHYF
ncbi:porin [Pandoraea captiosa]|uniref:Porin n=1 Tax=Pandoraea captiosa TaxID=2508302 RepID=A0A5E5A333_9BURK|nr:porin [Pandoraea captiosa]VVE67518.1 porin [Pandoraea captiosa]